MMGQLEAQENLFYRFRIEDHVPQKHLLRRIDWLLDFGAIHAELAALYSHTGRPSIDPELMLRMLLIGYLYGIRSERRLVEEVHLNLAYRWFCNLGLEGRVPDRSTFSKNRHGRFADGEVLRRLFESVVEKCIGFGIVGGTDAAIDGSTIEADANRDRRDAPDAVQKIWSRKDQVQRPVADYLDKLADAESAAQSGPRKSRPSISRKPIRRRPGRSKTALAGSAMRPTIWSIPITASSSMLRPRPPGSARRLSRRRRCWSAATIATTSDRTGSQPMGHTAPARSWPGS